MPTAYTAAVCDRDVSFAEFVMRCARQFSPLMRMRDEPSDAKIPERFEPDDYHYKERWAAEDELGKINTMSSSDCERGARNEYFGAREQLADSANKTNQTKARLETMIEEVESWEPPTLDHKNLKRFMLQQLRDTLRHDGSNSGSSYLADQVVLLSSKDWRKKEIARVEQDIDYHKTGYEKEVTQTEESNKWLAELRASLNTSR